MKNGYTLIEVLIALAVFAILAAITSSTMYHAFNNRSRIILQADRLNALQFATMLMEHDILQAVNRNAHTREITFSPFIGKPAYFELTRAGEVNPMGIEQRSSFKRIAWFCKNHQLIHRTWESLDTDQRSQYHDKILLSNLRKCSFSYLDHSLHLLPEWRENAVQQNQKNAPYPIAVQVTLTPAWGSMSLLFIFPGALYA